MLFVELMTGSVLIEVKTTSETSTVASHGIKDRKLVLVVKNQAGRLRQQTTSSVASFKPDAAVTGQS
jgi:hypothetical protein